MRTKKRCERKKDAKEKKAKKRCEGKKDVKEKSRERKKDAKVKKDNKGSSSSFTTKESRGRAKPLSGLKRFYFLKRFTLEFDSYD